MIQCKAMSSLSLMFMLAIECDQNVRTFWLCFTLNYQPAVVSEIGTAEDGGVGPEEEIGTAEDGREGPEEETVTAEDGGEGPEGETGTAGPGMMN